MMKSIRLTALAALVAVGASRTAGAQIVTNGGFEFGNPSDPSQLVGWTLSGNIDGLTFRDCSFFVIGSHTGSCAGFSGTIGGLAYLSQNVATHVGSHYSLSFWLANDNYYLPSECSLDAPFLCPDNEFTASLGGSELAHFNDLGNQGYQHFNLDYLATATTTSLSFGMRNSPSYMALDDVSMTEVAPEPATLLFVATGMFAIFGVNRRRPPRA